jgi:hypothetical protein
MTRKLAGAVAIGAAAIGILTATAAPALGHGPRAVSPTAACPVADEGLGSMMGMMGSRPSVGMTGLDAMGGMMDPRSMGPMGSMMDPESMHSMMGHGAPGGMMDPRSMGSMGSMMGMMGPGSMHSMMGSMGSMMGPGSMHSMMGSMSPDALDGASGPDGEDKAVDPVDHAAHHPAAIPEPTE